MGAWVQRQTRIWLGLGTALLVGGTGVDRPPVAREHPTADRSDAATGVAPHAVRPRTYVAQSGAAGEGGPNEGGGPVLGTITEFRLSSSDPDAFAFDGSAQVRGYVELVSAAYAAARDAAVELQTAIAALAAAPSEQTLVTARKAWTSARAEYLLTEAFQFYAGPVDGPGGPLPRLNSWPVDPTVINELISNEEQSLNFRALARLNSAEQPVKITTGLHAMEYLLWGDDGGVGADAFALSPRRGAYAESLAQLLVNDLTLLDAAWAPGSNNYRAAVEAMDQRNALGRAFNGMTVLVGYELPLRRIGAGLFPANRDFQPSPFSDSSEQDLAASFAGASAVYFDTGIAGLVRDTDVELADRIETSFEAAAGAIARMDAPYGRFLAPPVGSAERQTAESAVKALTNLARDLRQAGNGLGILVVVPGM